MTKKIVKKVWESKVGRTVATGVIGGATVFSLLAWTGDGQLNDARNIVQQLVNRITELTGQVADLEDQIYGTQPNEDEDYEGTPGWEGQVNHLENQLEQANLSAEEHLRQVYDLADTVINVQGVVRPQNRD